MINKFILPLVAIVLFSSCADKFNLQKRKYNKGYYFDLAHKKSSKKTESVAQHVTPKKANDQETVAEEMAVTVSANENKEIKGSVSIKPSSSAKPDNQLSSIKSSNAKATTVLASAQKNNFETKQSFKPVQVKTEKSKAAKGDSDVNLIVMIILCLFPFICLIPVYLHDGKNITLNFWIDLLLHLTFIGEIIFALLVVLDVVDLS